MNYLFKNEVIDYTFINNHKHETILFLHGWGGNKLSFKSSIQVLSSCYNILTLTLPTTTPTTSVWDLFDYVNLVNNLLGFHSIENPIAICHSFGFRILMLLNRNINFKKIIVTGGAGFKRKLTFLKKINKTNNMVLLKKKKFNYLYKLIASNDYSSLSSINKLTFKNIVNLNLDFAKKLSCPILLFWGTRDKETPLWISKLLMKHNLSKLVYVKNDHFAYLKESIKFNHEIVEFIKN